MKEGLKQRLVGAFVLTALAVIFLPGFFKEQQGHTVDTDTLIPPQPQVETVEFTTPVPTVEVEPAPAPETMFLPEGESDSTANSPAVASAGPPADSTVTSVSSTPRAETAIPDAWVVQVVSLSNKDAAIKLRDELQAEGHKAYIREVTTAAGVFNRVFIGPKLDKAEALAIKTEMDSRFKVNAQVRRFEP